MGPPVNRSRVRQSKSPRLGGRSPCGDINDTDYIDLLHEYKRIQEQLETIKQEEQKTAKLDDTVPENASHWSTGVKSESVEDVPSDMPVYSSHREESIVDLVTQDVNNEEEEDLEVMELRLAALASAAQANHKALAQNALTRPTATASTQRKPRGGVTGPDRSTLPPRRRRSGSERHYTRRARMPKRRCSIDRHEVSLRREMEKLKEEKAKLRKEKEQMYKEEREEERRKRLRKITLLKDNEEQYRCFINMMGTLEHPRNADHKPHADGYRTGQSKQLVSSRSSAHLTTTKLDSPTDNYEEVEMDIDSSCSSPSIHIETNLAEATPTIEVTVPPQQLTGKADALGAELSIPQVNSCFATSHLEGHIENAMPYMDMTPPACTELPIQAPGVASDHSHTDVTSSASEAAVPYTIEQEDDVEEDLLRAQLLMSLAQKRKEKEEAEAASSSAGSSPMVVRKSRVASPLTVTVPLTTTKTFNKPKSSQLPLTHIKIPIHEKVIINLADDSSDSDDDSSSQCSAPSQGGRTDFLGSLDMFLKEARKTAEANEKHKAGSPVRTSGSPAHPADKCGKQGKPAIMPAAVGKAALVAAEKKAARERHVKTLARQVSIERKLLTWQQGTLDTLRQQLQRKTAACRSTQLKAQKLREQLAAAEIIAKAHTQQKDKLAIRVAALEGQMSEKAGRLKGLAHDLTVLEKGTSKIVRSNMLNVTVAGKKRPSTGDLQTPKRRVTMAPTRTPEYIAKEKARLQALEQQYADMIQQFKASQAWKNVTSPGETKDSRIVTMQAPRPSHIVTEEKMMFSCGSDSERESLQAEIIRKRQRRSLIDLSPSTKPDLTLPWNGAAVSNSNSPMRSKSVAVAKEPSSTASNKVQLNADGHGKCSKNNNVEPDRTRTVAARPSVTACVATSVTTGVTASVATGVTANVTTSVRAGVIASVAGGVKSKAKSTYKFSMPRGQQLDNLRRLHKEHISLVPAFETEVLLGRQAFQLPVQEIVGAKVPVETGRGASEESPPVLGPLGTFTSPLLQFRSYRFSPYFRTKEKHSISSVTFSHKIQSKMILCRFDLMGKCNDEKCPWQHQDDLRLTGEELLMDIASYSPGIAGIDTTTSVEDVPKLLQKYVETFRQQNASVSVDELCVLLVSRVNEHAAQRPPHVTFIEPRTWRPVQQRRDAAKCKHSEDELSDRVQLRKYDTPRSKLNWLDEDNIVSEADMRYWMISGHEVQDLEMAVLEHPHGAHLWLKLAYKKLHNPKGNPERNLEHALNVLSRALEKNRSESDLWLHYLKLFTRREDQAEMAQLCRQAVQYAPSYKLYRKLLELSTSVKRNEICAHIKKFLCEQSTEPVAVRSHQLLEVLLLQVALNAHCGKQKTALRLMQIGVLERTLSGYVASCLCLPDRILVWLAYIHLLEFQHLPRHMFDPGDSTHSTVVNKEPWVFPWTFGAGTRCSKATLQTLFKNAINDCSLPVDLITGKPASTAFPVYRNLVQLHLAHGNGDEARGVCRSYLETWPDSTEMWQSLIETEAQLGDVVSTKKIFTEALSHNPTSSSLYLMAANYDLQQGNQDGALELLEDCAIEFFEVEDKRVCDPNMLYSKLLSQPLPLSHNVAAMRDGVTSDMVQSQQISLWLCYCSLLALQGDLEQAVEGYETALSTLKTTEHIHTVWLAYLRHMYSRIEPQCGATEPCRFHTFVNLIRRSLISVPTRFLQPHSASRHWCDYSFHNDVIDMFLATLPRGEHTAIYGDLLRMMPGNVVLAHRACEFFHKEGNFTLARGICMTTLHEHPKCLPLWKIHVFLASQVDDYSEVKRIYKGATTNLPYVLTLWKDFVLYEIAHSSTGGVKYIIERCRDLALNVADFISTILS